MTTEAEDFLAAADDDYRQRRYKEAHIGYGRALSRGSPREQYCRQMRGTCSRRVAEQRLAKAVADAGTRQQFLVQAARWLAKAEANLDSALEGADPGQEGHIRLEQALTEDLMAEFMTLSGGDPARRLALAETFRQEGAHLRAEHPYVPPAGPDQPEPEPAAAEG